MTRASPLPILAAIGLSIARLFVPTVGHSWPLVFIASARVFVGVMLALLRQHPRWVLGWVCLVVPTVLELGLFLAAGG
jgi:hypothetical protein